jgi:hypothetical protein
MSEKELVEKLNVPSVYLEEELDIQVNGAAKETPEGFKHVGLLQKTGGKYLSNALILDVSEMNALMQTYTRHVAACVEALKVHMQKERDNFLSYPFLSRQDDPRFVLWTLLSFVAEQLRNRVFGLLQTKHFSSVEIKNPPYAVMGIAGEPFQSNFYGNEGTYAGYDGFYGYNAMSVNGYCCVYINNLYGRRLQKHFDVGCSVAGDPLLMLTIRAIGGLRVDDFQYDKGVSPAEHELVGKAIACGYLRQENGILTPRIIVKHRSVEASFYGLMDGMMGTLDGIVDGLAADFAKQFAQFVPKHLYNQYRLCNTIMCSQFLGELIEGCIAEELLTVPSEGLCAEGVMMLVTPA